MTDSLTAAYIHENSGYQWIPTNISDQNSHGDAVVLKGSIYRFMVGRFKQDNWTSICKVGKRVKIYRSFNRFFINLGSHRCCCVWMLVL